VRALRSEDITFMVGPIGLWSHGEITAGFLVLCVPMAPKAFQNSVLSRTASSFFGSHKSSGDDASSRKGLPSWYRAKASKKPQYTDISILDERTLVTVRSDVESKTPHVSENDASLDYRTEAAHPQVVYLRTHGLV
jgi:hypothetical protein